MRFAPYLAELAIASSVSYLTIGSYLRYAIKTQILDIPNHRSSHTLPTPRGAGIAFAGTFLVFVVLFGLQHALLLRELLAIMAAALVAGIGYWDDRSSLSIRKRLAVQLFASTLVVLCLANFHLPGQASSSILVVAVLVCFEIFGITWLLNLTNFMDGIDGIVAIEVVTVTVVCVGIIVAERGMTITAFLFALLGVTVAPFLFFNWSPARIFMGDVGSCFIGFTLGVISLIAVAHHHLSLFCPLILLAVFISDATSTLLTRMLTGQRWSEPHRTHAFQILAQHFGHKRVSSSVGLLNLIWLAPLAIAAELDQAHGLIYTVIAFAPIIMACRMLGVGNPNSAFILFRSENASMISEGSNSYSRFGKAEAILHQVFPSLQLMLLFTLSLASVYAALLQHMDGVVPSAIRTIFVEVVVLWAVCQSLTLICFRMHRRHWQFTSVEEFPVLAGISLLGSTFGALCAWIFLSMRGITFSRTSSLAIYVMEVCLSILTLCGVRIFLGQIPQVGRRVMRRDKKPVLIYSADTAGISMLSEIRLRYPEYRPIGFIDERPEVHGISICGLKVLGKHEDLKDVLRKYSVRHVFIGQRMRETFATDAIRKYCLAQNVELHIVSTVAITSLDAA
jgi:Fuc2NAc and GlcNAc transferase